MQRKERKDTILTCDKKKIDNEWNNLMKKERVGKA